MTKPNSPSPYAVFSAIFGALSVPCFTCPVPAPLAIIFGHIALGHFGHQPEPGTNKAPAWAGLALGYTSLVIFVLMLVIGIVFGDEDAGERVVQEAQESAAPSEQPALSADVPAPPLPPAVEGLQQDDDVFLVEGDGRYHTFFCRAINDAQAQRTRFEAAVEAGFRPCELCQ
jgi:hypothetical protein